MLARKLEKLQHRIGKTLIDVGPKGPLINVWNCGYEIHISPHGFIEFLYRTPEGTLVSESSVVAELSKREFEQRKSKIIAKAINRLHLQPGAELTDGDKAIGALSPKEWRLHPRFREFQAAKSEDEQGKDSQEGDTNAPAKTETEVSSQ